MKRHEALAPLSREHHQALLLSQLLKKSAPIYKGLPETTEDKADFAVNFFTTKLVTHFRTEEQILEKVKHCSSAIANLADQIIGEHVQLAAMFTALQHSNDLADALEKAGTLLEAHIRKEERLLFPLIQQHCSEQILLTIVW